MAGALEQVYRNHREAREKGLAAKQRALTEYSVCWRMFGDVHKNISFFYGARDKDKGTRVPVKRRTGYFLIRG